MKKGIKKLISSVLATTLVVSSWSTLSFADDVVEDSFDMEDWHSVPEKFATPDEEPEQLTEADLQDMNDGNALVVYNEDGYATTIYGVLYEEPVHTYAELGYVIGQFKDLLGLNSYDELEPIVQTYLEDHITFTFRQMDGDFEVANSTLKVLIDEDNIPIMIQSSIVPDLYTSYTGTEIEPEEAEEVVTDLAEGQGITLTVFSDYTAQCVLNDAQIVSTRCYRIYTDNPFASDGADMPYLVHYVDFDGNYLKNYPTNNLIEEDLDEHDNDEYFTNLTATDYTFTVERDGEDFTFTVPVSYNSRDRKYYLADPDRKIILADFYSFIYQGNLSFEKSNSPDDWDDNHLITYYNYIQSYDFYASMGFPSTDGFGIPILILTEWCDANHVPVNNQCSMGNINGWSVFGSSDANTYGYSMDVIAHEYTHAITSFARQGNLYYNEYGAINEGFSDIMGNIAEMSMGETDDTTWALGETSGNIVRSMSDPTLYGQPVAVGDPYYSNTIALPNSGASGISDNGGVHSNDSLFSHLAYILYEEEGVSLTRLGQFYIQAAELHTPKADYDDMYAALIASAVIYDLEDIIPTINEYWEEAGMVGDRFETVRTSANDGYARFNLEITPIECALSTVLVIYDVNTQEEFDATAMEDGTFSICVPSDGTYMIAMIAFSDPSFMEPVGALYYSASLDGWTDNQEEAGAFNVQSGSINQLETINAR